MFDTTRLVIPLSEAQHSVLKEAALGLDREIWARLNPAQGKIRLVRVEGITDLDGPSYRRDIRWSVPPDWAPFNESIPEGLTVEFSLPKFWMRHNIHLLHNPLPALEEFKTLFEERFKLTEPGMRLPPVIDWSVKRVDCCYAWKFPSQQAAQAYLDSLKRLRFPRRKPVTHATSIFWPGRLYSVKLYLKRPEFEHNDEPELRKELDDLEWIELLEREADGVLRFEVTLRRQWLKQNGLCTLNSLLVFNFRLRAIAALESAFGADLDGLVDESLRNYIAILEEQGVNPFEHFEQERRVPIPQCWLNGHNEPGAMQLSPHELQVQGVPLAFMLLDNFLNKLVGVTRNMDTEAQVKLKLLELYKPNKAARLTSMWLYCRHFGVDEAKEVFGDNSFYYAQREMKKAGVSFVELPSKSKDGQDAFLANFRMEVPSPHVVNKDDLQRGYIARLKLGMAGA